MPASRHPPAALLIQNGVAVNLDVPMNKPDAAQKLNDLIFNSSAPSRYRAIAVEMFSLDLTVAQYLKSYELVFRG